MCSPHLQSAIHNLKSKIHRGHSSVGRAPALQAGSQGFESPCLQSLKGVEAKSAIRAQFSDALAGAVIPLPPAPKAVGGCRAVAWGKADIFYFRFANCNCRFK